jgi:hypothetical protein
MAHTVGAVHALERDLRGVFGPRLQSLVQYGLRAGEATPTRTMAIVDTLGEQDLRACAGRVKAWHDAGLATPLLFPAREFERSLDVFPLEFGAILDDHVVVSGKSPFHGLRVEVSDLRRACEMQARSHLLHLREAYLEGRGNSQALAVLIVQSAAPLASLVSSLARLEDRTDHEPAAAARHAERVLGITGGTIGGIVKLAAVHEITAAEAERLFPGYLDALVRLVNYIDTWGTA